MVKDSFRSVSSFRQKVGHSDLHSIITFLKIYFVNIVDVNIGLHYAQSPCDPDPGKAKEVEG